jgi:2-polyprenyl-3-methyl-5-hydroxy-6-metoxy-1,4-benzoquinol methylase
MTTHSQNFYACLLQDVSEFTKLSKDKIYDMVYNKNMRSHHDLFKFFDPKSAEEIDWFYKTNSIYLFKLIKRKPCDFINNVFQEYLSNLKFPHVLDFGAGLGTQLFALRNISISGRLVAIEKNILQSEFIKFRILKHNIDFMSVHNDIKDLNWIGDLFDIVIAQDVIEHLFDYKETVEKLAKSIRAGGYFFESTPFGKADIDVHMKDKYNLPKLLEDNGLKKKEPYIWIKN